MDLVDKLNPAEVLSHLRDMGYHNITPLQLKEFVIDLKKLIVYDQLSSSSGSSSSLSTSTSSESDYFSSYETLSDSSGEAIRQLESNRLYPPGQHGRYENLVCRASSKPALPASSRSTFKRSSFSSSSLSQKLTQKENLPPRRERTKSNSGQTLEEIVKPKTSFIRSRKLQEMQSGSQKPAPHDPVKLYHHYQSFWAKHKCPGEDSRAELRWLIREKMLGQDPHLYSKTVPVKKNAR
ncbi:uncharacterized protein LOC117654030 isoform X2 [Thrips palmi]|uniref:Uncharacterized protein LOC117654030 isoform X2 n=1 Tax=Thrips palmi TaxID=161013 RepID=A0A6P9AKN3_THRPL|nr:uncharacterized protein LOC117654030 isoform X2 [Thrips palmi]